MASLMDAYKNPGTEDVDNYRLIQNLSNFKGNTHEIEAINVFLCLSAIIFSILLFIFSYLFGMGQFFNKKTQRTIDFTELVDGTAKGGKDDFFDQVGSKTSHELLNAAAGLSIILFVFFIIVNVFWWKDSGIHDALDSERRLALNLSLVVNAPDRLKSASKLMAAYVFPNQTDNQNSKLSSALATSINQSIGKGMGFKYGPDEFDMLKGNQEHYETLLQLQREREESKEREDDEKEREREERAAGEAASWQAHQTREEEREKSALQQAATHDEHQYAYQQSAAQSARLADTEPVNRAYHLQHARDDLQQAEAHHRESVKLKTNAAYHRQAQQSAAA